MSLNYNLRDVVDGPHTRSEDGEGWGTHTKTLIFATVTVDMGVITAKNYRDFYIRFQMARHVYGWMANYRDLTLEVVKAHIGLSTNVYTTTDAAWRKEVATRLRNKVMDDLWTEEHRDEA